MQQIEEHIYIDGSYSGVTVGAIAFGQGTILIDAPPQPEDGRHWQGLVRSLGLGIERLLVSLDEHHDRTIGLRLMDCAIIAHQQTADILSERPAVFKGQGVETGADWENCEGLTGIRWARPSLTFSKQIRLHWGGDYPLWLEYHPGPALGAIWLAIPEIKVVFIGDCVTLNQPPFLAEADIPIWIEMLDLLLSPAYKNYLVVSGRGGVVDVEAMREQRRFLKDVVKRLERIHERGGHAEATETMIPTLLASIDFHLQHELQYTQRLRFGLRTYYSRHYLPLEETSAE